MVAFETLNYADLYVQCSRKMMAREDHFRETLLVTYFIF